MNTPNIKTSVKIGNCVLDIFAYKKLSEKEIKLTIRQWMKQTRRKKLPNTGHFKIISILGFDGE